MIKKITKEDFKAWLDDPCTKFFHAWIEKDKKELKNGCVDSLYANFQKAGHIAELASKIFGACSGLDRVLDFLKWSNEQKQEERENEAVRLEEQKEVEDYIGEHIKFVYGGSDENN